MSLSCRLSLINRRMELVDDSNITDMDDTSYVYDVSDSYHVNESRWVLCSAFIGPFTKETDVKMYLPVFEFTISCILLIVVALPGLFGNFISVFILSRPQMRTSLNTILLGNPHSEANLVSVACALTSAWTTQFHDIEWQFHPLPQPPNEI